jgi:hypothetical protein
MHIETRILGFIAKGIRFKNYTANHQLAQMHIKTETQNPSVEALFFLIENGNRNKNGQQSLPIDDL